MLAILGFLTILTLLVVIARKIMTPLSALIAIPVITALVAGFGAKIPKQDSEAEHFRRERSRIGGTFRT